MDTVVKVIALALWDHLRDRVHDHTVGRLRRVAAVATFPLVTPRANDPRLWRACARVAWKGLVHRQPDALDYFVTMRRRVEESQRFTRGVVNSGMEVGEVKEMRDEHVEAVEPGPPPSRRRAVLQ